MSEASQWLLLMLIVSTIGVGIIVGTICIEHSSTIGKCVKK